MFELSIAVMAMLILSAICSGSEAAIFSLTESKVRLLIDQGDKKAHRLLKLLQNQDSYISTIVLLNNTVNIMGSVFIGGMAAIVFGDAWIGVFSASLTVLIIIFAEILPKSVATKKSMLVVKLMSGPLQFCRYIFKPLIFIIDVVSNFCIRLILGKDLAEEVVQEAEISFLAKQGANNKASDIKDHENILIQNVFAMDDTKAKDIMTPRNVMTCIKGDSTIGDNEIMIEETQHSRIVVIGETVDDLVGIVMKTDLLVALKNDEDKVIIKEFNELNSNTLNFGESTPASVMLVQFQKKKQHLAIINDGYGGIAGVVSLEDVLEILVGEIQDESDEVIDLQAHAKTQAKVKIEQTKRR